jgi:hypothetical protein
MKFEGPIRYRIAVVRNGSKESFQIADTNGKSKFAFPATSRIPKIYVVTAKRKRLPIYVGITKQSMSTRLRLGCATGEAGYYGYAWRHHYDEVALDLWCQTEPAEEVSLKDAEIIEAELVFLIRQEGQWPEHQTEIHFHPSQYRHRRIAADILSTYLQ